MVERSKSLGYLHPDVARFWHPSLNRDMEPYSISPWARKTVWWLCGHGHAFQARIESMVSNPHCVACESIAVTHPKLAGEWDLDANQGMKPIEFTSGSSRRVSWRCSKGHSWVASISSRTRGNGCPYCSGFFIETGVNDLATLRPELVKEWDFKENLVNPRKIGIGSKEKVHWVCPQGHSYETVVYSRSNGSGCPVCAGKVILQGFNDLATTNPDVARSWDAEKNSGMKITEVSKGSKKVAFWLCDLGHSYSMPIAGRTSGKSCPYCANQRVLCGFNDLATKSPKLLEEWDWDKNIGIDPHAIASATTAPKFWWICKFGHSWQAATSNRSRGSGCPYCSGHKVIKGQTSLHAKRPDLFAEIDMTKNSDFDLENISVASTVKLWWICPLDHGYQATVGNRSVKGNGCPYCSGRKVLVGFNDLETLNNGLAVEWDSEKNGALQPTDVTVSSNKVVYWQCSNGHQWRSSVGNRSKGQGCPKCAGNTLVAGTNDLESVNPLLAAEWDYAKNWPLTPRDVSAYGGAYAWWFCPNGHSFRSKVANRSNGTNCPSCARTGYSASKPGLFYFIEHIELGARKVGITNPDSKKERIRSFQKHGWVVNQVIEDVDGFTIQELETVVLRWIRNELALPPFLSKSETPVTGGWSETFTSEGISNIQIIERIIGEYQKLKNG